ncbi:MAG: septum formation protein Maf [Cyclobacteriaceae bacterium]|nr:septum formation protein Maf [Cyclobacteriaceae bacterium]
MFDDKKIILASKSPRRQFILTEAGIDFTVKAVHVLENYAEGIPTDEVAQHLAEKKAKQFPYLRENEIVLAADTTVIIGNSILGKPSDREEAARMLSSLSGKAHHVTTGVCIKDRRQISSFSDTTLVYFKTLTDKEIDYYIKNFEPFDKAGGYGIQEWIGMIGVTKIEGSYFTVMGLPIHKVYDALLKF